MSSGKMEMAGLEPAYPNYFIGHPIKDATYPFRPRLHNRPLTVSTRIYRAMRDTIWFVLPLLLSRIGGFFAFFSVCSEHSPCL